MSRRTYILLFSFIFLAVVFSVQSVSAREMPPPGQMPAQPAFLEEYRIGGNDVLEISVFGEEDLSREVRVATTGYISYPLLGRIKAAGRTVAELENYLRDALSKDYIRNPQVSVSVKEFSNVYVLGQVNEPGPYMFKGGMTVVQAVSAAGGFTGIANQRKVRIVRGQGENPEVINVNVSSVTKGDAEDVSLRPGDKIIIPESIF